MKQWHEHCPQFTPGRADILDEHVSPLPGLMIDFFHPVPGTYVSGYYVPSSGLRIHIRRRRLVARRIGQLQNVHCALIFAANES